MGTYQALKLVERRFFMPLLSVRIEQGNYSKLSPECCKMALFAVQFSKNFQGSMHPDPSREAPTFGGRFVCD